MIWLQIYKTILCKTIYHLIILVICIIVTLFLRLTQYKIPLDTEIQECPFCYGFSFCEQLPNVTLVTHVSSLFNAKNVYYGTLPGDVAVVLKKLATNSELCSFDHDVRSYKSESELDSVDLYNGILNLLSPPDYMIPKLRLCPSIEHLPELLKPFFDSGDTNAMNVFVRKQQCSRDVNFQKEFSIIWSILKINPEPLLLELFSSSDGWPVPKYYGSCGRLAVVEYSGHTLVSFSSAPWLLKVYFSYQLLQAAYDFTFSHPYFSLYLTDLTPDNVAVDANLDLKVIDLENAILVDKNPPVKDQPVLWYQKHYVQHIPCYGCLEFSSSDVCGHHVSDLNLYAVCKEFLQDSSLLLPKGLLGSIPEKLAVKYSIHNMTADCVEPSHENRFEIAKKMLSALEKILEEENFSKSDYIKFEKGNEE